MRKISAENPYVQSYDLSNCDKEPIHHIQTVQSFIGIIAVDLDTWIVRHTSSNIANFTQLSPKEILNSPLSKVFPKKIMDAILVAVESNDFSDISPMSLPIFKKKDTIASFHIAEQQLIIEIERDFGVNHSLRILQKIDKSVQNIYTTNQDANLFKLATEEIKFVTGYDRVMIYQFDNDYNGEVIAEAKNDDLAPFLGIRYPASDIPKQARKLFLKNQIRILTDVDDTLSFIVPPLHPLSKQPLNVGMSISRGSSPIHLEYLRNMGVKATLTVAIIENGKLWGLIACHHYTTKKILDFRTRNLVRFFAQILAGHLSLSRIAKSQKRLIKTSSISDQLFRQIEQEQDLIKGLMHGEKTVLDYITSSGVAITFDDTIHKVGITPDEEDMKKIIQFLNQDIGNEVIFTTKSISKKLATLNLNNTSIAGFLAVSISKTPPQYIIWFREALEREITWGGNPDKAIQQSENNKRLSPRKSFDKWKQTVKGISAPWLEHEKVAALSLRNELKEVVIKRFEELQRLHEELKLSYEELETFSYTVSHDLRSPLRAIEGFAQILIEDYNDKLDDYGLMITQTIINNTSKMNQFIEDILTLSKLSNKNLNKKDINVKKMLESQLTNLSYYPSANPETVIKFSGSLPNIKGDPTMIRQVFYNILSNAIKYSQSKQKPIIEIDGRLINDKVTYTFKDNGIGFEMKYADIIFEVFNRINVDSDSKGSGIGLSIVKRIVDRHQGKIEVESQINKGATFVISFPK